MNPLGSAIHLTAAIAFGATALLFLRAFSEAVTDKDKRAQAIAGAAYLLLAGVALWALVRAAMLLGW